MSEQPSNGLPILDLRRLSNEPGLPALTVAAGRFLAEAAAVCLEDQQHTSGVTMSLGGPEPRTYGLLWPPTTEQTRRTFHDLQEATEYGACGVAILLILARTSFTVIERSRKGTGFDYWLGYADEILFQNKARLEVSGILCGTGGEVAGRMKEKVEQTEQSDTTGLPAFVVIVEFSRPQVEVVRR